MLASAEVASTEPGDVLTDHGTRLATLSTMADKIRHACEQVSEPTTQNVRAWLDQHAITTNRTYASSVVSAWRRERGLGSTGELTKLTPQVLAELDAMVAAPSRDVTPVEPEPVPVNAGAVDGHHRRHGRGWLVSWTAFLVGGVVSVAANVADTFYPTAAQLAEWTRAGYAAAEWTPTAGAMVFAGFWPVALILAVEVLTRVAWPKGFLFGLARYLGTTLVAVVAAVMSYRHMATLLSLWGEDTWGAHLGPLAVDGLMLVAAAALLSLNHQTRHQTANPPVPSVQNAS